MMTLGEIFPTTICKIVILWSKIVYVDERCYDRMLWMLESLVALADFDNI